MQRSTLKAWFLVHKWTSLVCTAFLLLLCLTGLPLVFWEEIGHLTGADPEVAPAAAGAQPQNLDDLVNQALARYPGDVPLFLGWDDHSPSVYVNTGADRTRRRRKCTRRSCTSTPARSCRHRSSTKA